MTELMLNHSPEMPTCQNTICCAGTSFLSDIIVGKPVGDAARTSLKKFTEIRNKKRHRNGSGNIPKIRNKRRRLNDSGITPNKR